MASFIKKKKKGIRVYLLPFMLPHVMLATVREHSVVLLRGREGGNKDGK